jgi:hypothetical protein
MRFVVRFILIISFLLVHTFAQEQGECAAGGGDSENSECAASTSTETLSDPLPPTEIDPHCPDREHIIRCAGAYLDTNKNGKLDRSELDAAINGLPWFGRGIVKLLGNTDKMMKKCDVDKDDAISMDYDMIHNKETCLATCFKRRAFKQSFFPDCAH